ncbi:MAG: tRNA adenosine(34) deaminase TadA [Synergistaceae bacterium]|nr:tRNA adenosine(34) deaminase TadA [Synergistaceae bacterium]
MQQAGNVFSSGDVSLIDRDNFQAQNEILRGDACIHDNFFMNEALNEARNAFSRGDVPVGALIVRNNEILSYGSDAKISDPTEHAEIIAIRSCARKLNHWNLSGCTLYVTLEPCPMCAGACVNARISRVVYGAKNYKSGAAGTLYNILQDSRLNHTCKVQSGVMQSECLAILQEYFLLRRKSS